MTKLANPALLIMILNNNKARGFVIMLKIGLIFSILFSNSVWANETAIQKMAGCYEVTFQFIETFVADSTYPIRSKEYFERGLEWIEVDTTPTPGEIGLKHVLITPDGIIKHWRQEWAVEPTSLLEFLGKNKWKASSVNVSQTQGMWAQRVYQVDDSPRYECVAPWITHSGQESWECTANAPLPRREFSKRSDYEILKRRNRHQNFSWGWLHEQDNVKLKMTEQGLIRIADEKGLDTYRRVEDSKCVSAKIWWGKNKAVWHVIQEMWAHIRSHHSILEFRSNVNGKTLWMGLFELADQFQKEVELTGILDQARLKKTSHDLIHQYLIE